MVSLRLFESHLNRRLMGFECPLRLDQLWLVPEARDSGKTSIGVWMSRVATIAMLCLMRKTEAKTLQCVSLGDFEHRQDRKVVGTDYEPWIQKQFLQTTLMQESNMFLNFRSPYIHSNLLNPKRPIIDLCFCPLALDTRQQLLDGRLLSGDQHVGWRARRSSWNWAMWSHLCVSEEFVFLVRFVKVQGVYTCFGLKPKVPYNRGGITCYLLQSLCKGCKAFWVFTGVQQ